MEAEERPSKLRKLSHSPSRPNLPQYQNLNPAEIPPSSPANDNTHDLADDDDDNDDEGEEEGDLNITTFAKEEASHLADNQAQAASTPAVLSKNQLKKLKRREEWEAGREDRKIRRKEKAKEKKARKRVERDEHRKTRREEHGNGVQHGDGDGDRNEESAQIDGPGHEQGQGQGTATKRKGNTRHIVLPISFVIDCGFDDLMHEREVISLGSQVTRAYSDNSKASYQAHLWISGWKEETKLRGRFEGLMQGMYRNWKGVKFEEGGFVEAAVKVEKAMMGRGGGRMTGAFEGFRVMKKDGNAVDGPGKEKATEIENGVAHEAREELIDAGVSTEVDPNPASDQVPESNGAPTKDQDPSHPDPYADLKSTAQIIYLTSDSPYTLSTLEPYHTYIIGGLVDKNRHKGLCYKTALSANSSPTNKSLLNGKEVRTAKLPIGEFMEMASRQVLATNHVVEILLKWLEYRDWGKAFFEVMPKRKGAKLKGTESSTRDVDENDGDDSDEQNVKNEEDVEEHQKRDADELLGSKDKSDQLEMV